MEWCVELDRSWINEMPPDVLSAVASANYYRVVIAGVARIAQ
jgi:hypothetical protein